MLKTRSVYALGVVVTALVGCSGPMWVIPPGGTQQQFRRDSYECERDAAMLPASPRPAPLAPSYTGQVYPGGYTVTPQPNPGQGFMDLSATLGDRAQREGLLARCMESKGYRKATADERRAEERRAPGRVGFRLEHRDTALIIASLTPGGPAERAGIVVGDRLVKVGGIPVDGTTKPEELSGMVTGAPGSKVLLTILRDNQEKDIVVIREVPQ